MNDAHKRNLAVPFFTQRDNTYYKDCSAKKRTIDNKHNGEAYY